MTGNQVVEWYDIDSEIKTSLQQSVSFAAFLPSYEETNPSILSKEPFGSP